MLKGVSNPQNHEAWEKFIARYGPTIRRWCRHWFPREADDKAHDVIYELVFRMMTFEYDRTKGRFRGWLKTVTHNLMAEMKREQWLQAGDGDSPLDFLEAGEDLAARLAAQYDLELLEKAKDQVRARVQPHTWAAYVATAEEGRKPAEVARELGMKVGAVYQAKHSVIIEINREIKKLQGPS
ncbi:MAG: sigma-70 family RNA polymerase sigma factor [Isosphaeraceae bacterium]